MRGYSFKLFNLPLHIATKAINFNKTDQHFGQYQESLYKYNQLMYHYGETSR